MTEIKFAKVNVNAIIPTKSDENAGFDVYACFEEDRFVIEPHETKLIPTGIASVCDIDYFFQLNERGSTGSIGMKLGAGVIDSGYRNEWFVSITNNNNKILIIDKNKDKTEEYEKYIHYPYKKAIAQAVLLPVPKTKIIEIPYEELVNIKSERGMGMLGSSGK